MYAIRLLMLLIMMSFMSGCTIVGFYRLPSIEGQVADAESGEPIEGAVVIVKRAMSGGWTGGWYGEGIVGYYKFQETLTDINGEYTIPSEGIIFTSESFDESGPSIFVFKDGYDVLQMGNGCDPKDPLYAKYCVNQPYPSPEVGFNQSSWWDGKTMYMNKFTGTADQYHEFLLSLKSKFDIDTSKQKCEWHGFEMPQWLRAIRIAAAIHQWSVSIIPENVKYYQECKKWPAFEMEYNK